MIRDILILDDDPSRHAVFRSSLVGHRLTHAHTALEAVKAMWSKRFDVVFLDHDLGDDHSTGYDVTKWMERMPHENRPEVCVVHSLNPVGSSNMMLTLRKHGFRTERIPYGESPIRVE